MLFAAAFAFNLVLVIAAIALHYEALYYLDGMLRRLADVAPRLKVLLGVCIIFLTHVLEIWLFGLGYFLTLQVEGAGRLAGGTGNPFMDCVYLSFVTFTTVGYGDIVAQGDLRYLTGLEGLTGLILITWSASFLLLEMQSYWSDRREAR
jgi:Ion channel